MLALSLGPANLPPLDRFPDYVDPLEDPFSIMTTDTPKPKPLAMIQAESTDSSRGPSPQPTHFSVPLNNNNGHRILRSATVGYIAPAFQGKVEQMATGESLHLTAPQINMANLPNHSQGHHSAELLDSRVAH